MASSHGSSRGKEMEMRGEEYCGRWIFFKEPSANANPTAYPPGQELMVGRQDRSNGDDQFILAWLDSHKILHVLVGVTLQPDGSLAGQEARDLLNDSTWSITIRHENLQITAAVGKSGFGEGNLTGHWGADAPPPPIPDTWIARILRWLGIK
jgi:hypothetical protein